MESTITARNRDDDSCNTIKWRFRRQLVMLQRLIWLSFAGACGTVSRYALCEFATKYKSSPIPMGTFTVNILGSFLFGFVYILAQRKLHISNEMRIILLAGFMGAFTTFSTFAFETAKMLKSEQWALAFGNVLAQVGSGVIAMGVGVLTGRALQP